MSGPVDVLAVMDAAIDNLQSAGYIGNTIGMKESRAAVAELIEADQEYDAARAAHASAHGRGRHHELLGARTRFDAARARREVALANVGSAS